MKVLLIFFVRLQWCGAPRILQDRTVNKEYYLEVMRRLLELIRLKRIELWKNQLRILQQDNVPAHTSMFVRKFSDKIKTVLILKPPYQLNLAAAEFFLFPKLKETDERKAFSYD